MRLSFGSAIIWAYNILLIVTLCIYAYPPASQLKRHFVNCMFLEILTEPPLHPLNRGMGIPITWYGSEMIFKYLWFAPFYCTIEGPINTIIAPQVKLLPPLYLLTNKTYFFSRFLFYFIYNTWFQSKIFINLFYLTSDVGEWDLPLAPF